MMFLKAILFKSHDVAQKILEAKHPRDQQALGRDCNFNQETWDKWKFDIVYAVNYFKFSQNKPLLDYLFSFSDETIFVEASPYDKVWGIGLTADDPRAQNESMWLGENLLGKALTRLRDDFNADIGFDDYVPILLVEGLIMKSGFVDKRKADH